MRNLNVLIIDESDLEDGHIKVGMQPFNMADIVIFTKSDGECVVTKNRWEYPGNTRKVEISLPRLESNSGPT